MAALQKIAGKKKEKDVESSLWDFGWILYRLNSCTQFVGSQWMLTGLATNFAFFSLKTRRATERTFPQETITTTEEYLWIRQISVELGTRVWPGRERWGVLPAWPRERRIPSGWTLPACSCGEILISSSDIITYIYIVVIRITSWEMQKHPWCILHYVS